MAETIAPGAGAGPFSASESSPVWTRREDFGRALASVGAFPEDVEQLGYVEGGREEQR